MIRLTSFLWLWFQCVCPLMPSCNTYQLLGFLLPGRGVSLHGCYSKAQPLLLTLDEGYLLMVTPPDLERRVTLLSPFVSAQLLLLGHGVALLGHCPWPQTWGNIPSKMAGGAQLCLKSNLIPARDAWRAQTKPCSHHDPGKEAMTLTRWKNQSLFIQYIIIFYFVPSIW